MRRALLALLLLATPAAAQTPYYPAGPTAQSSLALIAPTAPLAANNNQIANTSWVNSVIGGSGTVCCVGVHITGTANAGGLFGAFNAVAATQTSYAWAVTGQALNQKAWDATALGLTFKMRAISDDSLSATDWLTVNRGAGIAVTSVSIPALSLATNSVARSMEAQGVARSVIGVTGNATANVADIQGTANQFLGVNSAGTALAFNSMTGDCTLATGAITCTSINGVDQTAAWTSYSPTITSGTGTITSFSVTPSGRYKQIGKTVFLEVDIQINNPGTGAGFLGATLPLTAANHSYVGTAVDYNVSQKSGAAVINPVADLTHIYIRDATGATMIGAGGVKISAGITYELP